MQSMVSKVDLFPPSLLQQNQEAVASMLFESRPFTKSSFGFLWNNNKTTKLPIYGRSIFIDQLIPNRHLARNVGGANVEVPTQRSMLQHIVIQNSNKSVL